MQIFTYFLPQGSSYENALSGIAGDQKLGKDAEAAARGPWGRGYQR